MKAKITEVPAMPEITTAAATSAATTTVDSLKEGVAKATAHIQTTEIKMKEGMEKAMKTAEEFVTFSQGNMEALIKAGQIWATGMQDLSKQIATTAQASMEEGMTTFKALASVKSLKDAMDLQTSFARAALEKTMTESSKLTDASLKLTEQTLAPLTARMTVALGKFATAA